MSNESMGTILPGEPARALLVHLETANTQGEDMTSGTADKTKGRIEKAAGDLTGNKDLHDRGRVDETAGKVKDSVEKGVDKARDVLTDRPPANRKP
jgi:uncharacterized protein YjbJ (UPF0337 family)